MLSRRAVCPFRPQEITRRFCCDSINDRYLESSIVLHAFCNQYRFLMVKKGDPGPQFAGSIHREKKPFKRA
jgi:hypothetical protein